MVLEIGTKRNILYIKTKSARLASQIHQSAKYRFVSQPNTILSIQPRLLRVLLVNSSHVHYLLLRCVSMVVGTYQLASQRMHVSCASK